MANINTLYIYGFKKFENLIISFEKKMNIIVGENEVGKSTILEAIKIVINQLYKNADKSILKDLFNKQQVEKFKNNPCVENLPKIHIELDLDLNAKDKNAEYFFGENNRDKKEKFGIKFECAFNEEIGDNILEVINKGNIPYEYYNFSWITYAKQQYYLIKRPLNFISINVSETDNNTSFNYCNKTLFNSIYSETDRINSKTKFRSKINEIFSELNLDNIDEHRKFGINDKKIILETLLSVYEDSISLENKGSGMSSLIKTQIALDKPKNHLDVILMEEPENHLSYTTLNKMLSEIENKKSDSQIIIATHNNLIASRLNLKNVIWINDNKSKSLNYIPSNDADFFVKADNNNFLQLLLSKKAILVEGATEFLLLPTLYKQLTGESIEKDEISIISCNGISYYHYLKIMEQTNKKIAVLTDNDKKQSRIDFAKQFNDNETINKYQHIFMGNNIEQDWTWESCFYALNRELIDSLIEVEDNAEYLFHGEDYGKVLGKMLNNKVDSAYKILISGEKFKIPQYVQDAIKWLRE